MKPKSSLNTPARHEDESLPTDVRCLLATVYDMHALSEQGFTQIRGIVLSALAYMQTPDGYRHPETIAQTLDAVWQIADNIRDCITNHAEEAGNPYADTDREARFRAHRESLDSRT